FLLVPQSFLPPLTMPAHFSLSSLAAKAWWVAADRPRATKLATAARTMRSDAFIRFSIEFVGKEIPGAARRYLRPMRRRSVYASYPAQFTRRSRFDHAIKCRAKREPVAPRSSRS